jgi:hypothetical protein
MQHAWQDEKCTHNWPEDQKGSDHYEDLGINTHKGIQNTQSTDVLTSALDEIIIRHALQKS